jgi:regulator of sigma D
MNRLFFALMFGLGAFAVLWIASGFLMSLHLVALMMTVLIGIVYGYGALELQRFRAVTLTLSRALSELPDPLPNLEAWISTIHPILQNPVRVRIEGERSGLPGPAFTPYLVGVLVMLGMLGTFLGMVVTLNGAVFALEGTTDLQAIRSAFAAPIKGLGLSFGTSVAGVASSAILGLMSAISRRERMVAAQTLDIKIATVLRSYSHTFQRRETFKALQLQSQALPAVVDQLQAVMVRIESMSLQLNGRLLHNQECFHGDVKLVYTGLANSIDQSLRSSLLQSAHAAGDSIRPVVESAMASISKEARELHERMVQTTQSQLEKLVDSLHQQWQATGQQALAQQQAICNTLEHTAQAITEHTQSSAGKTLGAIDRMVASSQELARSRMDSEATWVLQHGERMTQLASVLQTELGALRAAEDVRGQAAVEGLGDLQSALASHLSTLGAALEDPIARLIQVASEAPRAAAEVIGTLRQEVSNSIARDNDLLEERSRILSTLNTLLNSIYHASTEQRVVIDTLVKTAGETLNHAGQQFASNMGMEASKLAGIADNVTSSAVEVSSLGDTLGFAVRTFSEANDKLIANLQRIETAMDKSTARSDDQLAYYVAQAREIIDLSVMSQKEIVQELRSISNHKATMREEVVG